MKLSPLCLLPVIFATTSLVKAKPINVLVWDERQPRQEEAYDNFLGNEIAAQLKAVSKDFALRSVALDDPGQGLSDDNLEWADVMVWWGHVRHDDVTEENGRRVLDQVLAGDLDLVILHSAHWARPFVEAMNWRTREDAKQHFAKMDEGKKFTFEFIAPPMERTVPTSGSIKTPAYFGFRETRQSYQAVVHLPWCCFPAYKADAGTGTITITKKDHPIARDLPATFQIKQTEMYNEPFHVPDPDEVILEETWKTGEHFRSGIVWNIGKGKVFYFRPGHETYPIFKQPEIIKILENACRWLGSN